jgi:hypothetical protein
MAGRTSGFGVDIQFGLFEDHEPFFRLSSYVRRQSITSSDERTLYGKVSDFPGMIS